MTAKKKSAIFHAVWRHAIDDLELLLRNGEDVNRTDGDGRTVLMEAATIGDPIMVRTLLKHGALTNLQDKDGRSALHFAAQEFHPDIGEVLLASGAEVDVRDRNGNTPLGSAIFYSQGRPTIIKQLIAAGPNPDAMNNHGVSPRSLAGNIAKFDVSTLLEKT